MLQSAYLLAKIGADTAEDEQHFAEIVPTDAVWRLYLSKAAIASSSRSVSAAATPSMSRNCAKSQSRSDVPSLVVGRVAKPHFSKILQFFGGLVLGCIKTKFCNKICVWQHFSSSTRFASFCTAAISIFSQKSVWKIANFANGKVFPLQSFSAPCRNSNFLSEQFTTIGATGETGEIGDTGARYRCCRSQKISIISLRHRRGSCIVISTEDIGTIRVANS